VARVEIFNFITLSKDTSNVRPSQRTVSSSQSLGTDSSKSAAIDSEVFEAKERGNNRLEAWHQKM
jgi:outer membrane scaffolding protein for murein synthesis (MipA/OmpV family)